MRKTIRKVIDECILLCSPLLPWSKRIECPLHVAVAKDKRSNKLLVDGVSCNFEEVHAIQVDDITNERGGAHCSLADTFELILYIHERNLHSLISRASRDPWISPPSFFWFEKSTVVAFCWVRGFVVRLENLYIRNRNDALKFLYHYHYSIETYYVFPCPL